MSKPLRITSTLPLAGEPPRQAQLICLRRSSAGQRIEKAGVEVGGALKHYAPAGILFVLKLGAWRLQYLPPVGPPLEVGVVVGPDGEERLHAGGNTLLEDDGLSAVPLCTHRTSSGSFDVVR